MKELSTSDYRRMAGLQQVERRTLRLRACVRFLDEYRLALVRASVRAIHFLYGTNSATHPTCPRRQTSEEFQKSIRVPLHTGFTDPQINLGMVRKSRQQPKAALFVSDCEGTFTVWVFVLLQSGVARIHDCQCNKKHFVSAIGLSIFAAMASHFRTEFQHRERIIFNSIMKFHFKCLLKFIHR